MANHSDKGGADGQATYIGPGAKIVGDLHGALEVRIDGKIEGSLHGKREVIIGSKGHVKGSIEASTVQISGRVQGDVNAGERVQLSGGGHLEGQIVAPNLVIEPGAFFKGEVDVEGGGNGRSPNETRTVGAGKDRSK